MKGFTLVKNLSTATTVIRNSSGRTTWERIREQPFNCYHCDKKFIQKDDLRVHERLHTGEKPFNCHHCDKKFIQKDNLRAHLRTTIQLPPLWQEIRKMEDKRTRLSDKEKFEILLASKRPGFNKEEVMKKYGISKSAFYNIIKQRMKTPIKRKRLWHCRQLNIC